MSDASFESPKANLRLLGYPPRRNLKKKTYEDLKNENTKNLNSSLSKMKMGVSSEYPYF